MLPFTRPALIATSHTHSPSPPSLREQHNNHRNIGYTLPSPRSLLTRDSPNRLAGPQDGHIPNAVSSGNIYNSNINTTIPITTTNNTTNNNNNSLMRSFHSHRSIPNRQQPRDHAPNLSSVSLERLPRSASSASSPSQAPPYYSDRANGGGGFYPSIPERWDRHAPSLMTEDDDRTTTSGSYSINTDDLRHDIDQMALHDSIV